MRAGLALCVALAVPLPAFAGPVCTFSEECTMTMACKPTDYVVVVDRDKGVLATQVEDLEILQLDEGASTQIVARGMGALGLLTIGANTAILSVHIGAGPMVTTYYGSCAA